MSGYLPIDGEEQSAGGRQEHGRERQKETISWFQRDIKETSPRRAHQQQSSSVGFHLERFGENPPYVVRLEPNIFSSLLSPRARFPPGGGVACLSHNFTDARPRPRTGHGSRVAGTESGSVPGERGEKNKDAVLGEG